jgi:transcriptional regulator with XRE-family HTH domain
MLGCSKQHLSDLELAKREPSVDLAARIEMVFEIPARSWAPRAAEEIGANLSKATVEPAEREAVGAVS